MSDNKKYYYLKLKENFFNKDELKLLEKQENGYIYSNLYLKLCLMSLKGEGKLLFRNEIPFEEDMISTITGVPLDNVRVGMVVLRKLGLIKIIDSGEIFLTDIQEMIGHASSEGERKKVYREKLAIEEKKQAHIPYIENYINDKRYGGNYYKVFKRDGEKCIVCKTDQGLKIHHIDKYDENDKTTCRKERMITLCNKCHGLIHKNDNKKIMEIVMGHLSTLVPDVSQLCPTIRPPELELELEKELEREEKNKFIPPTLQEIIQYINQNHYNVNAKQFLDYFTVGNWIDSKGKKVKNWKQKLITWNNHNKTKQKTEPELKPYPIPQY